MPQNQSGHIALFTLHPKTAKVTNCHFDLGDVLHRVHRFDQGAQRQQHGAHVGGQHWALLHVGHKMALTFMKAYEYRALFSNKTH